MWFWCVAHQRVCRAGPFVAEIEVMSEVDPDAPVVEGVIVGEVPGDLPE